MLLEDRIYTRTEAGEQALALPDVAIPAEYRRLLWVVESDTHADVIRGRLRQFPDSLLADWLAELEELGYLSSKLVDPKHKLDIAGLLSKVQPSVDATMFPGDRERIESQARRAGAVLERSGAFLSLERLCNQEPLVKSPNDTTVLVVEDDPDQAALADLRVSMAGYQVRVVSDCKQLLQELRTRPLPDLLLLDVMLPDVSGFEIVASMRRHPKLALVRIVMLSTLASHDYVRQGLVLGADGYITKPYSKKILSDTLREVLGQR